MPTGFRSAPPGTMASIAKLLLTVILAFSFQSVLSTAIPAHAARDLSPHALSRRGKTPNGSGKVGLRYYFFWWSDGGADPAEYENLAPGSFSSVHLSLHTA